MLLTLDAGNTHIFCGVFDDDKLILRFRHATHPVGTADQFGIFLRAILRENGVSGENIEHTALCSVVPALNFTLRHALAQYFEADLFELKAGARTGLNIKCKPPTAVGADRIAGAIGASHAFPGKNAIVVDMGTTTVFDVVTKDRDYLGGAIMPGLRLAMDSLTSKTAQLTDVDIEPQDGFLGQTTREAIQKGLYYGHLGALKEMVAGLKKEVFGDEQAVVIGTGGFAQLYRDAGVFTTLQPDLVLHGLRLAHAMSRAA